MNKIVDVATSYIGSCACTPYRESMALAVGKIANIDNNLIKLDWRPFSVIDNKITGISTCGMFTLNIYNICGIIKQEWKIGNGLGIFETWGRKNNCWIEYNSNCNKLPKPGDLIVIGKNEGTHVAIVAECNDIYITTIDGGQVCRISGNGHENIGRQCIKKNIRKIKNTIIEGWIDAPVPI